MPDCVRQPDGKAAATTTTNCLNVGTFIFVCVCVRVCLWALISRLIIWKICFELLVLDYWSVCVFVYVCICLDTPSSSSIYCLNRRSLWLISFASARLCLSGSVCVCVYSVLGFKLLEIFIFEFTVAIPYHRRKLPSSHTHTHADKHLGTRKLCRVHNRFIITYYFEYLLN